MEKSGSTANEIKLSYGELNDVDHTISATNGSASGTGFVLVLDENFSIERSLRFNSTSSSGQSKVLHVSNSSGQIAIAGEYSGASVMINNHATDSWEGTGCSYLFVAKPNLTLDTQYLTNLRNCRTGAVVYDLESDNSGNEYILTSHVNPTGQIGLVFNNNGVYSSSSIILRQTMNGESCGGSGQNLAIGKINSGSWQWAKQIGGQSWSLGLSDGLVFTGSNLVFAGQSWPCFFDSTKQIVIGSTTINNMNNSHYVELFGTLSTSGTWGSVRWSGGSTNAFMGNTKISPHPSGVMLSGLYKATSYDTNFSTVSFADDEGPWMVQSSSTVQR